LSQAFPRQDVEGALKHHTTAVIAAYNHQYGLPEPSENDKIMTEKIMDTLKTADISLQKRIIISEEGFFSY
jgi:DNA repair protein RadC